MDCTFFMLYFKSISKALFQVLFLCLFQPLWTDSVFSLIDGVGFGNISPDCRHLLGNILPILLRNQHTLLEVSRFSVPPDGINENLRDLPLPEIPTVGYADVKRHTPALCHLLCCPEFKSYRHTTPKLYLEAKVSTFSYLDNIWTTSFPAK